MTERAAVQSIIPKVLLVSAAWWRFVLLMALLAVVFGDTVLSLVRIWMNRPDYSHGFLIPLISAYFIWTNRDALKEIKLKPALVSGSIIVVSGSLLFLLGSVGSISILQQMALVLLVPGFVLLFAGREYLKQLALPIAYLIFMIPVLDIIFDNIREPFQLFSAVVTAKTLHFFGIAVFQNKNFLELPHVTLEVARACSGVQYLVSIIAVGIPLAYVTLKTMKLRIALILSAVIIGILINPLRITLIALWSTKGGEVHGPLHIFQGLFVSVAGYCMLFLLAFLFSKINPGEAAGAAATPSTSSDAAASADPKKLNTAWSVAILIMLSLAVYHSVHEVRPVTLASAVSGLPLEIGAWRGALVHDAKAGYAAYGADSEVRVVYQYQGHTDRAVSLYAGYFASQNQDKKIVDYRLQRLYDHAERIRVPTGTGSYIEINKAMLVNNGKRELVLYWYDLNGRIIAGNVTAKMASLYDAVVNGRSNGAVIIVETRIGGNEDTAHPLASEIELIQGALPALQKMLSAGSDA